MFRWLTVCLVTCVACSSDPAADPASPQADTALPVGDVVRSDVVADASTDEEVAADVGPAEDTAAVSPYPSLTPSLETFIVSKMFAAKVPGLSACIVKDEAVFWCGGFGKANLEKDTAVTEHTPFLLASISKTFTAAVLLQLWEDGVFQLDQDVDTILGWDVALPSDPSPITPHHLMTHHAGIRDNWSAMGEFYFYDVDPALSLQETVEGYFQPDGAWYNPTANFTGNGVGAAYEYANMGIALAAHLVEALTGEDFAARSRATIFEPLGLENTGWWLADFEDLDQVAMPYQWQGGQYHPTGHYTFSDYPDGGLRASAYDLARFLVAHIRGGELDGVRILEEETVAQAISSQVPASNGQQGLIWYAFNWAGDDWWGHNGGESGVFTEMFFRSSDKMGFVALMNGDANDPYPIYDIEEELMAWAEAR